MEKKKTKLHFKGIPDLNSCSLPKSRRERKNNSVLEVTIINDRPVDSVVQYFIEDYVLHFILHRETTGRYKVCIPTWTQSSIHLQ